MKTALITTTIYVPRVLALYREIDKDVAFFIAGDRRTPHDDVRRFVTTLGNAVYYSDSEQEQLGYVSSSLIGWNCITRRNIALLEAIKWGAEIIATVDDDNIPLDADYFSTFRRVLSQSYSGLCVSSDDGWFNVGHYLIPPVYHRGFPFPKRSKDHCYSIQIVQGARVGVAAGLWFGDPDIDAIDRIATRPEVHQVSEVLRRGLCVQPGVWAPINSQNTAYLRELAPLFMVWSGVGRYEDIWASYVAQRIMRNLEYYLHYGPPFVWQERNPQSLLRNLQDELYGMEHTVRFCEDLRIADLGAGGVLEQLERLYAGLQSEDYLPPVVCELGTAWCKDVGRVL